MIQEFSIENTLSINEKQTISFEAANDTDDNHIIKVGDTRLLKHAALYGANASGKSNVLAAFQVYVNFMLNSCTSIKPSDNIPFTPFLGQKDAWTRPGRFDCVFFVNGKKYRYSLSLGKQCVVSEQLSSYSGDTEIVIFGRTDDTEVAGSTADSIILGQDFTKGFVPDIRPSVRRNASFFSVAAQFNHPLISELYRRLNDSFLSVDPVHESFDKRIINLSNLLRSKMTTKKIVALLSSGYFGNITDITEVWRRAGTYHDLSFKHNYAGLSFDVPYASESDGTKRFLDLCAPLLSSFDTEKILCIDEIDSSLHDDILKQYIELFLNNSAQSQMLFTTHNQSLLDSDLLRDDEVWFVQKNKQGASELFSLADFEDVPPEASRRDLYKAGAFGALPLVGMYMEG